MNPTFHPTWSPSAKQICEKAIARHGGIAAWNALEQIRIKPVWLRGMLPAMKGYPKTFELPDFFEVFPKERKTIFHKFPDNEGIGIFERGDVRLIQNDQVISERKQARAHYRGVSKNFLWRPIDCLYFFGYAWTTYISSPFVFPEFEFVKSFRHSEKGQTWDAIVIRFPESFDTHCKEQTFYFDDSGLLRRNDYFAEIVGGWAMGAHYSGHYQTFKGIKVALQRRVFVRFGTHALPITALAADLKIW